MSKQQLQSHPHSHSHSHQPHAQPGAHDVSARAGEPSPLQPRLANQPEPAELQRAQTEILRDDVEESAVDEPNIMGQRLDARPFSTGKKVENQLPHDDQTTERSVREGVSDADQNERSVADKDGSPSEG